MPNTASITAIHHTSRYWANRVDAYGIDEGRKVGGGINSSMF